MGLGPALATPLALARGGVTLADMGLVELNEAFAAVSAREHGGLPFEEVGRGASGEDAADRRAQGGDR